MAPQNFKNMLKMLKRETSPAAKPSQDLREKERELKTLLQRIDLENPTNRLSAKKFKELNIEGVIRYAYSELKYPLIVEYDLTNLDNSMKYIISALEQSIKDGLDTTAEWACTALVFAIKSLRAKVDGIDANYADALWECRTNYAFNLELLVKSCIEYDRLSAELADQKARRKERREELDKLGIQY